MPVRLGPVRLWLARALVALVAAWCLLGVSQDARWTRKICTQPEPIEAGNYRPGSPTWLRLADFTERIGATVPAGEVIAFRAASGKIAIARYASFLLPSHHVIAVSSRKIPDEATFTASFGGPWRGPNTSGMIAIARHPDGWIYRRP